MKTVPNCISFIRIVLSLILFFVKPLSAAFYTIYIICGLSDALDGLIARRTGTTSKLGAKLDSFADMIMIGVLLFVIYPIVSPRAAIILWIVFIFIIRLSSIMVALKRYKTFASIHTYGNKITGAFLCMFPMLIPFIYTAALIYAICTVATISAVEELIIMLTSGELQLDRKSILHMNFK